MSSITYFPPEILQLIIDRTENKYFGPIYMASKIFHQLIHKSIQISPHRLIGAIIWNDKFIINVTKNIKEFPYGMKHVMYSIMHDRVDCYNLLIDDNCKCDHDILFKFLLKSGPQKIMLKYYPGLLNIPTHEIMTEIECMKFHYDELVKQGKAPRLPTAQ
jgi:hypothetical protein